MWQLILDKAIEDPNDDGINLTVNCIKGDTSYVEIINLTKEQYADKSKLKNKLEKLIQKLNKRELLDQEVKMDIGKDLSIYL